MTDQSRQADRISTLFSVKSLSLYFRFAHNEYNKDTRYSH
ncbi:hypothetical protein HPSH465_0128 [Glaesserella parasuis H465]|nr:hypothetical protein HPSH465_0128 [Glaesserella parasuis H465]